jgi:galactokinase/mevalonate kinase-like predicted kinase
MNHVTFSAPGRVDLSGGAADIFGGCTLSVAIDLRAVCNVAHNSGPPMLKTPEGLVDLSKTTDPAYNLISAITTAYGVDGVTLSISSEIPPSSGLGGSASIAVAALSALNIKEGWGYHKYEIAERAQRIETLDMSLVNGYQDQYAAVFGSCLFMDFAKQSNRPLGEEPYAVVESLEFPYPLVVAHTGISHNSGASNSSLVKRYGERDPHVYGAISKLNELTRDMRTAVIDGSYEDISDIISRNQDVMRAFGRSYPENERHIHRA